MGSTKGIGRVVGVLLLVHLAVGLMTPFILLDRVRGTAGFLANAAGSPALFRTAVLMLVAGSAMAVAAAAVAGPVLRRHSEAMAFALLGLAVAAFSLQVVDTGLLMSILALSQEHARSAATNGTIYESLGAVIGGGRRWVHYSYLLVAVGWILLLSATLFRFQLVPRALAGLVATGCLLQLSGVSIPGLLGIAPVMAMAMPMAPVYLGLSGWLVSRGFADHPPASARSVAP